MPMAYMEYFEQCELAISTVNKLEQSEILERWRRERERERERCSFLGLLALLLLS